MVWWKDKKNKNNGIGHDDDHIMHGPSQNGNGHDNIRHLPAISNSSTNPYYKGKNSHYSRFGGDDDDYDFGYYSNYENWGNYKPRTEKDFEAYDFLKDYSQVFNLFSASTPSFSPYSNKAIYIIDILSKLGVKFRIDVFPYSGGSNFFSSNNNTDTTSHRLINIIAEPNPNVLGPALVFSAHHDVANTRSENCQDNGASVCNLLRLAALISQDPTASQRTLIVFTDCEESGAKGARRFADEFESNFKKDKDSEFTTHKIHGEISGVIILELTGHGKAIWTDCAGSPKDQLLHKRLEAAAKKPLPKFSTPPSDVYAFRGKCPSLCIGILKTEDLTFKSTWGLCHSMRDTIEGCEEEDMKDFTEFLHEVSKVPQKEETETNQLELELE